EKIEYHTHFKRVARTDPVLSMPLVSLKDDSGKEHRHILPLESDDPDALRKSPLQRRHQTRTALSELASSLMGPGPWTVSLEKAKELTDIGRGLLPSNKNRRSNITISHLLKCIIRVEKRSGWDDEFVDWEKKKKKLFDIVVQTPIQILSVSNSSTDYH
ncbi:hypothetical protein BDP27DRAFT_1207775, partial [Rhodocollybia butyracea]